MSALLVPPRMKTARNLICFIAALRPARSFPIASGAGSGDPTEDRARHQARPAGIVIVEQSTYHFAAAVESGNRLPISGDHLRVFVDLKAAEGKGYSPGDGPG